MDVAKVVAHQVGIKVRYAVECWRRAPDGSRYLAWADGFENLVVTEGRNTLLGRTFDAVPANVDWFVGLKGAGTVAAGDTLASHAGWSEITAYSGNRKSWVKNGAPSNGAMSNSSSKAQFTFTGSATVAGAFMASVATGTTGLLFGAGDFSQSREVVTDDQLNVEVSLSVTAS